MSKKVAILTGGGEVPGLNICLKRLVTQIIDDGFEPYGVRKGWEGLINYNPEHPASFENYFVELTDTLVRPIDRSAGSFLHSSRIDPQQVSSLVVPQFLREEAQDTYDLTDHIKHVIKQLDFSALIVIGDDDMLSHAAHLSEQGIPIIAIPKTVHNNIYGTEYTIGFTTALARSVAFIHELSALAASREQIVVIETFGVDSGISSLMTAFLAGVDRAIIPEVPYDPGKLAHLLLRDKRDNPNNYAVMTISNGATMETDKVERYLPHLSPQSQATCLFPEDTHYQTESVGDANSLISSGMVVAELLQHLLRQEVFLQPLTYLLRTGLPDGQDLIGATNFALLAARLLKEGDFGRMTAYQGAQDLTDIDLSLMKNHIKTVDVEKMYNIETYQPKVDLISMM
ncbi:MAG: 6-phosphofructokinase [Chloroflexota bacterium]